MTTGLFSISTGSNHGTHLTCLFCLQHVEDPSMGAKSVLWWHEWQISSVFFRWMSTACLPTAVTHAFIKSFKHNLACIVCNWVHSLIEATDCWISSGKLSQTRSKLICLASDHDLLTVWLILFLNTEHWAKKKVTYHKRRVHVRLKQPIVTQKVFSIRLGTENRFWIRIIFLKKSI